jgi:hypothetical protein
MVQNRRHKKRDDLYRKKKVRMMNRQGRVRLLSAAPAAVQT